jgi:hypothetical protein
MERASGLGGRASAYPVEAFVLAKVPFSKPKPEAGKPKPEAGKPKPEAGKPKPEAGKPKPAFSFSMNG